MTYYGVVKWLWNMEPKSKMDECLLTGNGIWTTKILKNERIYRKLLRCIKHTERNKKLI